MNQSGSAIIRSKWKTGETTQRNTNRRALAWPPVSAALAPRLCRRQTAARSRLSRRLRAVSWLGGADPRCRLRRWVAGVLSARTRCRHRSLDRLSSSERGKSAGKSISPQTAIGTSIFARRMSRSAPGFLRQHRSFRRAALSAALAEQTRSCLGLARCVAPGGLLVIRDCPRDNGAAVLDDLRGGKICAGDFMEPEHAASFSVARAHRGRFCSKRIRARKPAALGEIAVQQSSLHFPAGRVRSCSGWGMTTAYPRSASPLKVSSRQRGLNSGSFATRCPSCRRMIAPALASRRTLSATKVWLAPDGIQPAHASSRSRPARGAPVRGAQTDFSNRPGARNNRAGRSGAVRSHSAQRSISARDSRRTGRPETFRLDGCRYDWRSRGRGSGFP